MNGCNVSEGIKPLPKSLLASGVTRCWRGSQSTVAVCQSDMGVRCAHTDRHMHTFTPTGNTRRPLCQSGVYLDCGGSGRESAKCARLVSGRSLRPSGATEVGQHGSGLSTVGRCHWAGHPDKNTFKWVFLFKGASVHTHIFLHVSYRVVFLYITVIFV